MQILTATYSLNLNFEASSLLLFWRQFIVTHMETIFYFWSPFCFQVNREFLDLLYFRLHQSEVQRQNSRLIFPRFDQPGVVAHACNPATWRLGSLNGLRVGFLGAVVLCRSGVRAKFGVNMGNTEESEFSRLVKEERTGPGWKHSRQKLPRQTVVG